MEILLFIVFIGFSMAAAVATKKLTIPAALTGGALSVFIFCGLQWTGIILMAGFFIIGTVATSWGKRKKELIGVAQENEGRRRPGQVLANGGVGALLGLLAILFPAHLHILLALAAASFSSATADTVSSELGSLYGTRFYDILSFKKGRRGADGVISIQGLLFGLAGSIIIASLYVLLVQWTPDFFWIIVAGTIGNLADSVLGATLERKGYINNDTVNFSNTAIAALLMLVMTNLN